MKRRQHSTAQHSKKFNGLFGVLSLMGMISLSLTSDAQSYRPDYLKNGNGEFITRNFEIIDSSGWFHAIPESAVDFDNFFENKQSFGMGDDDGFILTREKEDNYPFLDESKRYTHSKFNQTYKGIEVETAELFLHHKNNRIEIINGKVVEGLNMDVNPALSESSALTAAMNHIGSGNLYSWQDTEYESDFRDEKEDSFATTFPEGELLIAKKNIDNNYDASDFALAWKFSIHSLSPEDKSVTIYVDATTGTIIREFSNLQNDAALSFGYGTQYVDTWWRGGWFQHHVLKTNDINGRTIYTKVVRYKDENVFNPILLPFGGNNINNSFDSDGDWGTDRAKETTPHWVATNTWDYFKSRFNRSSWDDNGMTIKVYVGYKFGNAFYDKENDWIVVGKYSNGSHFGSKDIIGHEYTHGIVRYTAGLNLYNESGALNESFSDIFGYEVERYLNGGNHTNWTIGEDLPLIIRKMDNPSFYNNPAFYHGSNWYYGTDDYGGVHTNSGVQNYWFYLLTQGSISSPDGTFNSITVSGIGADKASNIAYYNLDNFLGENSNYSDSRSGSILSAFIIFGGNCTNEYIQTTNAWAAVGLGKERKPLAISGPSNIFYNASTGNAIGGMPVNFEASGGYATHYLWNYTGSWSYSILNSTSGFPWENIFSVTNFNNNYSTATIHVSDRKCDSVSKTVKLYNFGNIIEINPNPVTHDGLVRLRLPLVDETNPVLVKIYDLQGNLKLQQIHVTDEFTLDLSFLNNGNYIIHATQNEMDGSVQFIKE